jgi:hypothetical protein
MLFRGIKSKGGEFMKKVTIEIFGGVASVTSTEKDIEVTFIDHDEKVKYKNIGGINCQAEDI